MEMKPYRAHVFLSSARNNSSVKNALYCQLLEKNSAYSLNGPRIYNINAFVPDMTKYAFGGQELLLYSHKNINNNYNSTGGRNEVICFYLQSLVT